VTRDIIIIIIIIIITKEESEIEIIAAKDETLKTAYCAK
jgi:hypothetical protein